MCKLIEIVRKRRKRKNLGSNTFCLEYSNLQRSTEWIPPHKKTILKEQKSRLEKGMKWWNLKKIPNTFKCFISWWQWFLLGGRKVSNFTLKPSFHSHRCVICGTFPLRPTETNGAKPTFPMWTRQDQEDQGIKN